MTSTALAQRTWAGNHAYRFAAWHEPDSVAELTAIVRSARHLRVVGSRHCFNDIADAPDGDLVSLRGLPTEVGIDADRRVARVTAWSTYAEVGARLHAAGWALPNTASLPHITVGGAIATGSHGSGDGNRVLGGSVVGLELIDATGERRVIGADDPDLAGHVVGLGAMGVWTHVHLAVEPTFEVASTVRVGLPWREVLADLDAVTGSAYSVSLFSTDLADDTVGQAWLKARVGDPAPALDLGRPADAPMHMLAGADPAAVTPQLGEPGPWHERLPHFRAEFTPSRGAEVQSEYLLPREHAVEAVTRLREAAPRLAPALQVAEVRTMAADDLWLSPAAGRATAGFHFTWVLDREVVDPAVAAVEEALLPLGARPHWGKVFHADTAALAAAHPRLPDVRALRDRLDPDGVFTNPYLQRVLG